MNEKIYMPPAQYIDDIVGKSCEVYMIPTFESLMNTRGQLLIQEYRRQGHPDFEAKFIAEETIKSSVIFMRQFYHIKPFLEMIAFRVSAIKNGFDVQTALEETGKLNLLYQLVFANSDNPDSIFFKYGNTPRSEWRNIKQQLEEPIKGINWDIVDVMEEAGQPGHEPFFLRPPLLTKKSIKIYERNLIEYFKQIKASIPDITIESAKYGDLYQLMKTVSEILIKRFTFYPDKSVYAYYSPNSGHPFVIVKVDVSNKTITPNSFFKKYHVSLEHELRHFVEDVIEDTYGFTSEKREKLFAKIQGISQSVRNQRRSFYNSLAVSQQGQEALDVFNAIAFLPLDHPQIDLLISVGENFRKTGNVDLKTLFPLNVNDRDKTIGMFSILDQNDSVLSYELMFPSMLNEVIQNNPRDYMKSIKSGLHILMSRIKKAKLSEQRSNIGLRPLSDQKRQYIFLNVERSNFIADSIHQMHDYLTKRSPLGQRKLNTAGINFIKEMKCSKEKRKVLLGTLYKSSSRFKQINDLQKDFLSSKLQVAADYIDEEKLNPDIEYLDDLVASIISSAFKLYQNLRDEYGYTDVRCKDIRR